MPKSPPPPRTAQNRSGSEVRVTWTSVPVASTRSTLTTLLAVKPCLRVNQLAPPPSSSPTTVGSGLLPARATMPVPSSAAPSVPHCTPAPTRAVARARSTTTSSRAPVRSRSVPSRTVRGAWPRGCALTGTPCATAQRTAATTSSTSATSRTAAGCWGTLTSQGVRAASQPGSSGLTSRPRTAPRRAAQSGVEVVPAVVPAVVLAVVVMVCLLGCGTCRCRGDCGAVLTPGLRSPYHPLGSPSPAPAPGSSATPSGRGRRPG